MLAAVSLLHPGHAQRADDGDWIETWTANPQPIWNAEFFAPINIPRALRNQTLRQIAAISIDGNRVRVVLSNECGELVDLRINDITLWCECAECHVVNIEDTLSDLDDDEV